MRKIAYILAGAALCLAACTHKQLGEVGMYEKDLMVHYDWSDVYEESRGNFADEMDNFLYSNIFQLSTFVMPVGAKESIDTLIERQTWGNAAEENMDHLKRTLFNARSNEDRAHFTGVYNVFVTSMHPKELSVVADLSDMMNTIPTNFEFYPNEYVVPIPVNGKSKVSTKVNQAPQEYYVPGLNELPFGEIPEIFQLPPFYYGGRKNVVVTPGTTEKELSETNIPMKRLDGCFISLNFDLNLAMGESQMQSQGLNNYFVSSPSIIVTGLASGVDLLSGNLIGGYNFLDIDPWSMNDGYKSSVATLGISPMTGKCEVIMAFCYTEYKGNDVLDYYCYRKADITDQIRNAENKNYIEIEIFKDPFTLPSNLLASGWGPGIVWNEIK